MELRRAHAPDDPFLAAVRRRCPEADLVVLPPGPQPDPAPQSPAQDGLTTASLRVGEVADELWQELGEPVPADVHWARGPGTATVVARSRLVRRGVVRDHFVALAVFLARDADVRRQPGVVEQLVTWQRGAATRASWASSTGVLVVEVRSAPVAVGADRVSALVEVDGWGRR